LIVFDFPSEKVAKDKVVWQFITLEVSIVKETFVESISLSDRIPNDCSPSTQLAMRFNSLALAHLDEDGNFLFIP
jgi:hypothetical protein